MLFCCGLILQPYLLQSPNQSNTPRTLLCYRYKEDISTEQKEALLGVLRVHVHEGITPEIRRELMNSKCRDEETAEPKDMDF